MTKLPAMLIMMILNIFDINILLSSLYGIKVIEFLLVKSGSSENHLGNSDTLAGNTVLELCLHKLFKGPL